MVKLHREKINRLLVIAALSALVVMVAVLVYVERSFSAKMKGDVETSVGEFQSSNVLKTPRDLSVDMDDVIRLAETSRASSWIENIYVVKHIQTADPDGKRIVLFPYYHAAQNPSWERDFTSLKKEPIEQEGESEPVGYLYFDLDKMALGWVQFSICIAILSIALASLSLISRIYKQEKVLTATTEILEENQRELIRMERLSLAGLLTANIFHDIRKPITNIKHELADLSEALGGFAGATRALHNMRDQTVLFFDILRDLNLERFVRSDEAEEEYVDANRVVEQALRLVQYERGSTQLGVTLKPGLPLVLAHPYRLVQVFSNIILNAYQALEGRGELRVATRALPLDSESDYLADFHSDDSVQVGSAPRSEDLTRKAGVLIEIHDNGPGIPEESLQHIFSPFYSTKPSEKGTGLGLYISRSIIEQLGGALQVTSQEGKGTRFAIILYAAD